MNASVLLDSKLATTWSSWLENNYPPHSNKLSFHWNNDPSNRKKTNLFQRITLAKKGLDHALLIHVCQAGINRTIVLD